MQSEKLTAQQRRTFDKVFYPFADAAAGIYDLTSLRNLAARYIRSEESTFLGLPLEYPEDALIEELMDCERRQFDKIFS